MELVTTAYRDRERDLLLELEHLGSFEKTEFRDVIKGEVVSLEAFLKGVEDRMVFSLSRVTPIEKSFYFSPQNVVLDVQDAVKPLVERIRPGETFCVRVIRRGFKGWFSSQEVARETGSYLVKILKDRDGVNPKVDLEDPDKAVIIETIGNWCGVGVISKAMRKKCYYIKLP